MASGLLRFKLVNKFTLGQTKPRVIVQTSSTPRENAMTPLLFHKILVPVDFSPCSREAFRVAVHLAKVFQAQLLLLHVIDSKALEALNALGLAKPSEYPQQKQKLRRAARVQARQLLKLEDVKGLEVTRLLSEGKPFVEIVRTARMERVNLIVMGSYGGHTSDVERIFFGSTAEQVVRTAHCPVLCIPFPSRVPHETGQEPANP
ncbi:MAG: universal stress protein [Nitrospirae bacterium]|nr:MAG: universal stress protein [Nitrospirota bacterium]